MSAPPAKRQRTRAIGPDSIELAKAFTHKTVTTTNRSGEIIRKDILVPLVPVNAIPDSAAAAESSRNVTYNDNDTNILPQEYDGNLDGPSLYNNNDDINNSNNSNVCIIN
jgi:hypothetical protein